MNMADVPRAEIADRLAREASVAALDAAASALAAAMLALARARKEINDHLDPPLAGSREAEKRWSCE